VAGDAVLSQAESVYAGLDLVQAVTRGRFHDATGTGPLGTPTAGVPARASYAGFYYDPAGRPTTAVDAGTNGGVPWARPAAPPSAGPGFAGADAATAGAWPGVYGGAGFRMALGPADLPAGASVTTAAPASAWDYAADARGLALPGQPNRLAAAWYSGAFPGASFTVDVDPGSGGRVSAYLLDWDRMGRVQRVEVLDPATGAVLDSREEAGFGDGRWLTWAVAGPVRLRVTSLGAAGTNAVLGGVFVGHAPLVSSTAYDAAGRAWQSVSPRGVVSRAFFDAAGRTTRTVEHWVDGVPSAADDRTTEYAYGPAGMTALTLRLPGGGVQATGWGYGVTAAGGNGLTSNDVVSATHWPDPATGLPAAAEADRTWVNALGEAVATADRTGTQHAYRYDALGRPTGDAVVLLGANVDGAVRRVEVGYDGLGNPAAVTSFSAAAGGAVVNQVRRGYNGLGRLTAEWQAAGGPVTAASPRVGYAYAPPGGANHGRPTALTYPDGRTVGYSYGPAGGLDDRVSRLAALTDGGTTLEDYAYLGVGTVVRRGRPQAGVELTHVRRPGEPLGEAGDPYAGLGRFGQVADQRWVATATGAAVDRQQYAHDRDGNRTARTDAVNPALSEAYTYDGLGQLTGLARGGQPARGWGYDAAGNRAGVTTSGVTVTAGANRQNEVTAVGGVPVAHTPAGQLAADEHGRALTYDAWGRLARVASGATTLAAYTYDGLGRRATSTEGGATTTLVYSAGWQVLEERVGGVATAQYVWSPVYVDALVARDRDADGNSGNGREERLYALQDANHNVTAVVGTDGQVRERYGYDPFGAVTVYTPTYAPLGTSGYAWTVLFQGLRQSPATGLYHARNRDYSATLGRWVTTDPIGFAGGDANLYRFVGNGPTNAVDPSGLWSLRGTWDEVSMYGRYVGGGQAFIDLAEFGRDSALNQVQRVKDAYGQGGVLGAGQQLATDVTGMSAVAEAIVGADDTTGARLSPVDRVSRGLVGGGSAVLTVAGGLGAVRGTGPTPRGTTSTPKHFCFPPNTLVSTEAGLRPISGIEPGDRVWAFDFRAGGWRMAEVEARHDSQYVGQLVTLHVEMGEVTATAHHPVWVVSGELLGARPVCRELAPTEDQGGLLDGRWVNSHEVRAGDVVFLREHGRAKVERVVLRDEQTPVCNLTVRNLHTFTVGQIGVLVHNTSGSSLTLGEIEESLSLSDINKYGDPSKWRFMGEKGRAPARRGSGEKVYESWLDEFGKPFELHYFDDGCGNRTGIKPAPHSPN
jgi:RHS repeat-associated protein